MQSARFFIHMTLSCRPLARLATTGLGLATLTLLGLAAPDAHAQGYTLTTLASFNGINGDDPFAGLTLSADGKTLYGTTDIGGANNNGTVFSVPVTGGTPTDLVSFSGSNGSSPFAGVTLIGSTLYGTTTGGGANYDGSVFSVPAKGGTPTTLVSFNGSSSGGYPYGGLTLSADGKTLYGATESGGAYDHGMVFSVPVTGGTPTVLASFDGTDGSDPSGDLALSADGKTLYGTTQSGGAYYNPDAGNYGNGAVFSVPVAGGTLTDLVSFSGSQSSEPTGGLTLGTDGTLYGTITGGGAYGDGTVFALTPTPAAVPEASTTVSFGLLLTLGMGGMIAAKHKNVA